MELLGLSTVEELLIYKVITQMSICNLPYDQIGYRGHVVNLPQEVSEMVINLPRLVSD